MAEPIRFHLDENVNHAVARGLTSRGIQVTTATDAGLIGATDDDQLAYALSQQAVLFTHDPDLLRLHQNGAHHSGIVFCLKDSQPIGEIVRFLCLVHDVLTPDEICGRVEFL